MESRGLLSIALRRVAVQRTCRQLLALGTAGVMHLALVALLRSPPPPTQPPNTPTEAPALLSIDLAWGAAQLPEAPALGAAQLALASVSPATLQPSRPTPHKNSEPNAETPADAPTGAPEAAPEPTHEAAAPHLTLQDLGVGNSSAHWEIPGKATGPSAKSVAARKRKRRLEARIEQGMAQKVLERDVERGIGPGGPALSAFEAATRGSAAPVRGYAVFQLTTDADGRVLSLSLVEADGGTRRWNSVGEQVLLRLSKQRLRVAGTPTRLLLRVESTESLPSGADPGFGVEAFGVPLKKGEGKKSAKLSVLSPPKLVEVDVPDPGNPRRRLRMPLFVPPTLLGLGGDLSDVGAERRRVVYARVLRADALTPPRRGGAEPASAD